MWKKNSWLSSSTLGNEREVIRLDSANDIMRDQSAHCWALIIFFSLGWVGGINDSEHSYWVFCGGGYDVRQAARITPHHCGRWRIILLYWVCCISLKWLFFCVLADNWSNVLACVISVSLPACNCLISPPQYLCGLTLKWNDLIRSVGLRILWSFRCNQTYFCLRSLFSYHNNKHVSRRRHNTCWLDLKAFHGCFKMTDYFNGLLIPQRNWTNRDLSLDAFGMKCHVLHEFVPALCSKRQTGPSTTIVSHSRDLYPLCYEKIFVLTQKTSLIHEK